MRQYHKVIQSIDKEILEIYAEFKERGINHKPVLIVLLESQRLHFKKLFLEECKKLRKPHLKNKK